MIALSDAELDIIMRASAPLEPARRSQFLERVAAELASLPAEERGVGSVSRLVRQLQRDHHRAPDLSHDVSKYR
jgi:hypothetical protein